MDKKLYITDENGVEKEMEILLTFEPDGSTKKYVLYYDPEVEDGDVFASIYDDEGHLFPIETEAEWDMVEEVLNAFNEDEEDEE
jgi:uncharacterized protein YrzB (UPF0473 family)